MTSQAKPTHRIEGRTHDGRTRPLDTFYSREEADADLSRRVFSTDGTFAAYRVVPLD